jgi:hypothetical protein
MCCVLVALSGNPKRWLLYPATAQRWSDADLTGLAHADLTGGAMESDSGAHIFNNTPDRTSSAGLLLRWLLWLLWLLWLWRLWQLGRLGRLGLAAAVAVAAGSRVGLLLLPDAWWCGACMQQASCCAQRARPASGSPRGCGRRRGARRSKSCRCCLPRPGPS